MISDNMINTLNRQKYELQKTETQLGTGKRIHMPSDDPIGATNQMFLSSRVRELKQYEGNVQESYDNLNLIDGYLGGVGEIFQRMRELSIQAANGTNTSFELKEGISKEINQHLKALVDIGNAKDATGRSLFGGSVIERDPFLPAYTHLASKGIDQGNAMTGVQYQGDTQTQMREIERNETMAMSIPGNKIFWGTNTSIDSNRDASGYVANGDQTFSIDGIQIPVSAGDTINDIIDKINNAPLEVRATKGGKEDLILTSTSPHQIWLKDEKGGTVLQDLGMIDGSKPQPPNNFHPNARVSGLSIFDLVIQLRNDLIKGDQNLVGGRDLEAIDMAMENILRHRAEVGAKVNRLEQHRRRITWDQSYVKDLLAKNESIDVTETIVNLKWLENVHNYALKVGAGMIKPTLMDFLR